MFSRTWRNVRNEPLNTELAADVTYNKPAIDKLVKRVRQGDRAPAARTRSWTSARARSMPTTSQTGVRVKYNSLRQGSRDDAADAERERRP